MTNEIHTLIGSYRAAVRTAVAMLEAHVGTTALLDAVRIDRTLRTGSIDEIATYAFHGVGCRFTCGGRTVDFDFGPDGITGGFDSWRLWLFATSEPTKFADWQDRADIEPALSRLHADGTIELPRSAPSRHLYYPSCNGENAASVA